MTRHHRIELAAAVALALVPLRAAVAQVPPAFPGAEGFGAAATMQKTSLPFAGSVYHVTNLNDSGAGSLRQGVLESGFPAGGRVIVFDVGGTINLLSSLDIKNVNGLYIAGQTAPSPVTIYGDTTQITSSPGKTTQNVIVRNLAFRKGTGNGEDAITFAGSGLGTNLILDHVSASWAEDEVLSVANNNTNVTIQYAMINDALVSNHAYGSLIRPQIDSNVSFHHNLYAHNASRQARFGTYNAETLTADFRNNVVYNWRDRASYAGGSSEPEQESVDVNYVGNYLIAGPGTTGLANRAFTVDKNTDVRAYQSGNFIDPDRQLNPNGQPNGADTGWAMWAVNTPTDQTLTQMGSPFAMAPVATQSAIDAYNQLLSYVGNFWWNRDAIDARVINNVTTNTGPPIAAAAPNASELNGVLSAPMTTRAAGWDTDNDGMPNAWELAHGLNPNTVTAGADFDSDGYSNIEEYLNETGAFPAPRPIGWNGTVGRYALNGNWDTWQPSRFDTVNVNAGKATVDAVGQHAGALRLNGGEVEVTAGWLDVSDRIDVNSGGTLRLTGGSIAIGNTLNLNSTAALILGGGTLALNAAGQFNWNGGTLRTTVNQSIGMNANIGAAGATLDTTDKTVTYSGNLAGAGGFTKLGSGRLIANNLKVGGAVAVNGGTLEIAPNGSASGMLETTNLTVADGALLAMNDNDFIVNYAAGDPSPELSLRDKVKATYLGGTSGISYAVGAGDVALAVAEKTEWGFSSFNGVSLDDTTVIGKYTYFGDANLDGKVTSDDYVAVDVGLGTGNSWVQGDFNFSGTVTSDDYVAIDVNLGKGTPTPLAWAELKSEMIALHTAMFGDEYVEKLAQVEAEGFAALVPEPGPLGLVSIGAAGMLRQRRQRINSV